MSYVVMMEFISHSVNVITPYMCIYIVIYSSFTYLNVFCNYTQFQLSCLKVLILNSQIAYQMITIQNMQYFNILLYLKHQEKKKNKFPLSCNYGRGLGPHIKKYLSSDFKLLIFKLKTLNPCSSNLMVRIFHIKCQPVFS